MFKYLNIIDSLYWSYIGIYIVILIGLYFTIKSRFYQFRTLINFSKNVKIAYNSSKDSHSRGISPLRLYFASVGGRIGLGNVVAVTSAVLIGGPGSLIWLWITALLGMIIKYCEIYLGIKYRINGKHDGYNGGSIYYLERAYKTKTISIITALLLGIYGVEIYIFKVVSDNLIKFTNNLYHIDNKIIIFSFLALIVYSSLGGVKRLANICSRLMPAFIILYIIGCLIILSINIKILPDIIYMIFKSAFLGHAPIGGFLGSTMLITAQQGTARAVYSADIGIGFDSIINSETKIIDPNKQANLVIYAATSDALICTMSIMVILVTGVWSELDKNQASISVIKAFNLYFPHTDIFMSILFFVAGYTTLISYLTAGTKCAQYINFKYGKLIYFSYAIFAFIFSYYIEEYIVMTIMSLTGGILSLINIIGIFKLRNEIKFN